MHLSCSLWPQLKSSGSVRIDGLRELAPRATIYLHARNWLAVFVYHLAPQIEGGGLRLRLAQAGKQDRGRKERDDTDKTLRLARHRSSHSQTSIPASKQLTLP